MTLDPLVALPAVAAAIVIYRRSAEAALLGIYLPALLLLPDGFVWGWPPLGFHQYAILPIGLALVWRMIVVGGWRISWTDVVVFTFIGWMFVSTYHAIGMEDIANRLVTPLTIAVFPYMAGKLLIEQHNQRVAVIRRFIFLLFIDAIISTYEFRFAVNPVKWLFPSFLTPPPIPWHVHIRYGFGRVAGPFGHAIFMGAIIAIGILLHIYATHFGLWEKRFRWFPTWRLNKPFIILSSLIAASIMTISRGPWIAAVAGIIIASIGLSKNRWHALRRTAVLLAIVGTLFYWGTKSFISEEKGNSNQEEVASAEYRTKLLTEYQHIALVQSVWGWGENDWPKVPGMPSIDNWYLLVTIMYGITGLVLFLIMMAVPTLQLLWTGMFEFDLTEDRRGLIFTLSGIIVAIAVAIATVYLGNQLYHLVFFFLGWGDACLTYRPKRVVAVSQVPRFAFQKVIV